MKETLYLCRCDRCNADHELTHSEVFGGYCCPGNEFTSSCSNNGTAWEIIKETGEVEVSNEDIQSV